MRIVNLPGYFYLFVRLHFNKVLEIECQHKQPWIRPDFSFELKFSVREDHAGLTICFIVWRLVFRLAIVDSRHWSDSKNQWLNPGEQSEDKKVHQCPMGK